MRHTVDFSMWQDNDFYQEMFSYLLEELSAEDDKSSVIDDFHLEEFNVKEELSEADKEVNSRNMVQEFRLERRQFC